MEVDKNNLTESEKREAKKNGFILAGKTGAGKSTLINTILGKEVAKVGNSSKSETEFCTLFYYKLENKKCICLVDTPGLFDTKRTTNNDIDKKHLEGISNIIEKEGIFIKGILFLVNFQNERFDDSEKQALKNYNGLFPLKKFWEYIIVVFTHCHGGGGVDGDEETVEEKKSQRDLSNEEIFKDLMKDISSISDVIEYSELKQFYCNCTPLNKAKSSEGKNRIKTNHIQIRDRLEIIIDKLANKDPLFTHIEIATFSNYQYEKNGKKYIGKVKKIGYMQFDKLLIEDLNPIDVHEINENNNSQPKLEHVDVIKASENENGQLTEKQVKGDENNSNYVKASKTGGILGGIAGAIGGAAAGGLNAAALSGFAGPALGIALSSNPVGWAIAGGIAVGAVGIGLGHLIGKLFN